MNTAIIRQLNLNTQKKILVRVKANNKSNRSQFHKFQVQITRKKVKLLKLKDQ